MGFSPKWAWRLLWALLFTVSVSAADSTDAATLQATVLVVNSAHVAPALLRLAERESARIFLSAGIEISWINCGPDSFEGSCPAVEGSNQFVVHIVPRATTFADFVFGVAFLGDDGRGRYCDVFFAGIAATKDQPEVRNFELLGAVMSHELGHLLLGSHSHSVFGIMMPVWDREGLRHIGMGDLSFTRQESSRIRARLGKETLRNETRGPVVAIRREPSLLFLGRLQ